MAKYKKEFLEKTVPDTPKQYIDRMLSEFLDEVVEAFREPVGVMHMLPWQACAQLMQDARDNYKKKTGI